MFNYSGGTPHGQIAKTGQKQVNYRPIYQKLTSIDPPKIKTTLYFILLNLKKSIFVNLNIKLILVNLSVDLHEKLKNDVN